MMTSPRRLAGYGICLAILLTAGCGTGDRPHQADPTQAKTTLHAVLDAWKSGAKPESLADRTPPIRVLDLDWKGGHTLLSYEASAEGKLNGYDLNYPVILELKKPKGGTVKKTAVYTVTTHPEILVMRQEG